MSTCEPPVAINTDIKDVGMHTYGFV